MKTVIGIWLSRKTTTSRSKGRVVRLDITAHSLAREGAKLFREMGASHLAKLSEMLHC